MKKQIIPSIIAKNQKELDKRFNKVKNLSTKFHLDIMDGKFVKNKSLMFDFKLPKKKQYEAHLMIKSPETWIKKNSQKVNFIIFHYESSKNPKTIIKLLKQKNKKIGISINPKTSINKIKPYLPQIDKVLIMTVYPGKYGAKFLNKMIIKIKQLRKLKPKLNFQVDGGINENTIKKVNKAGADIFVSGSYLQKSIDNKQAFLKLKSLIK